MFLLFNNKYITQVSKLIGHTITPAVVSYVSCSHVARCPAAPIIHPARTQTTSISPSLPHAEPKLPEQISIK